MTPCVQGYGHRFTDGDAYIDVITWLYDRRDISSVPSQKIAVL